MSHKLRQCRFYMTTIAREVTSKQSGHHSCSTAVTPTNIIVKLIFSLFYELFSVLGTELGALNKFGKHSNTQLHTHLRAILKFLLHIYLFCLSVLTNDTAHVGKSEDNLCESVFSLHHTSSMDKLMYPGLAVGSFYSLSYLAARLQYSCL